MEIVGERIIKLIDSKDAKLDSTHLKLQDTMLIAISIHIMNTKWVMPILQ
jgi:hypothetical protein